MRADYLAVVAMKAEVDIDGDRHDAHEPFDQATASMTGIGRAACASPPRFVSAIPRMMAVLPLPGSLVKRDDRQTENMTQRGSDGEDGEGCRYQECVRP